MIEDMQAQMLAMQEKVQEAQEFEQRISKLADDGKLKFKEDGELDIVVDRAEQSHLQESRKKEREQRESQN